MIIGRLDRLIEIQYPSRAKNTFGEETVVWKLHARVWAQAQPLQALERFKAAQERESKVYTFRLRYVKGVKSDMRVYHDSQSYRILGIAELGRREGLELTAEYFEGTDGGP